MLDLQPIKDRLEAATSWSINGDAGEFQRKATGDVYDLVAEVERLRADADVRERYIAALEPIVRRLQDAIKGHQRRCVIDPQPWDRDLWGVLQ